MISEQLIEKEAKSRNVTTEQLVATEITAKMAEPTDAEIQKVYDDNKAQLAGSDPRSGEAAHRRVPEAAEGGAERQEAFIDELKGKYKTTVALKPPGVERRDGAVDPRRGARQGARHDHRVLGLRVPVLQARASRRSKQVHEDVRRQGAARVPRTIRSVPRALRGPPPRPRTCANAQGKFWEYHEKLLAASRSERPTS